MGSAVKMGTDYSAAELRRLAKASKDANQSRRLLSLALVRDGRSRAEAAKIGGMDRQTLRDWVHRFNASGPEGLKDAWWSGPAPRLSPAQKAELAEIVETGPDPAVDGVVRWRRVDLQKVITARFGVAYHERYVSTLLKQLGFSHMSARPRHPAQDGETVEAYKKLPAHAERASGRSAQRDASRGLVPGRSQDRAEERPRAAMGQTRHAAQTAGRPALRERLSVRRHLPGARNRRSPRTAVCRHRGHAAPPRRDQPPCRKRRARRAAARPRRLAHDGEAREFRTTSRRSSCHLARQN